MGEVISLKRASIIQRFAEKSGSQLLNAILDMENPKAFVRSLSEVDFYWLVKRIGEDDALPLLELASTKQWIHILDMGKGQD